MADVATETDVADLVTAMTAVALSGSSYFLAAAVEMAMESLAAETVAVAAAS